MKKPKAPQLTTTPFPKYVRVRKLDDLKPHPSQDNHFHALGDAELRKLADEIERDGLRERPEVTPGGVIISGHQRVRALRLLGRSEVEVEVRSDLEGEKAVELRLIEANENRRHLDPLDRLRLERRKLEIEAGVGLGKLPAGQLPVLRDRGCAALGMSRKNVSRYLRVLAAPMAVQRAVSAKALPMTLGARVASMKKNAADKIAAEILKGGDPVEVVTSHLPRPATKAVDPGKVLADLLVVLDRAHDALEGRESEIRRSAGELEGDIKALRRFAAFSKSLRASLWARVGSATGVGLGVEARPGVIKKPVRRG